MAVKWDQMVCGTELVVAVGCPVSCPSHHVDSVSCNNINTGVLTHQPETGRGAKINKSQVVLTRTNGNLQSPWPSGRNQVPRARGDSGPLTLDSVFSDTLLQLV